MNKTIWTMAALAALGFAVAACAKDSKDMTADANAAPAAEAAPDASAAPNADAAGTASADEGSATVPEAAPQPEAAAAAAAAPEPPPPPQTEYQKLRDVRYGARALYTCVKIENVTVDTFMQCVNDAMSTAEAKGGVTDSFKLGVDYRAWAFLGEHASDLREKGLEWSKGYRKARVERETYRQSAANLLDTTGLSESKVCNAIDVSDCPK